MRRFLKNEFITTIFPMFPHTFFVRLDKCFTDERGEVVKCAITHKNTIKPAWNNLRQFPCSTQRGWLHIYHPTFIFVHNGRTLVFWTCVCNKKKIARGSCFVDLRYDTDRGVGIDANVCVLSIAMIMTLYSSDEMVLFRKTFPSYLIWYAQVDASYIRGEGHTFSGRFTTIKKHYLPLIIKFAPEYGNFKIICQFIFNISIFLSPINIKDISIYFIRFYLNYLWYVENSINK